MDKTQLANALQSSGSIRGAARTLGYSPTNIRYWIKKHGLTSIKPQRKRKIDEIRFRHAVESCTSVAQVLGIMGLAITGSGYQAVRNLVQKLNLDTTHWKGKRSGRKKGCQIDIRSLLVENGKPKLFTYIKARLISEGLLRHHCHICFSEPVWMGEPLVLVLDHINGIRNDHRIENLRLVCPNCNSQLPTFCGRNSKR